MAHQVSFIVTELGPKVDPFMLHIYAALAEKERQIIAQRTKEALAEKKAQGFQLGNRTNLREAQSKGHQAIKNSANQFAANVLPIIDDIISSGRPSLKQIAHALNSRGVQTARGGSWYPTTVKNLLARRGNLTPLS